VANGDGSWWSLMVVGGGGRCFRVWVSFGEGAKNASFLVAGDICNLHDSVRQNFACLGELAQLKHV